MSNETRLVQHIETYGQEILSFLRSRVSDPDLAQDLLQQTYLRLFQRANWATVENPKAYLKSTARNVLADHYSLQSVRFSDTSIEYIEERDANDKRAPSRLLQSHQQLEKLYAGLQTLSPSVRQAFILSRVYGHTYSEVGEMLGLSPRTVEKHVAKGLTTCFAAISNDDPGSSAIPAASAEKGR